jgi:hypothetical protein
MLVKESLMISSQTKVFLFLIFCFIVAGSIAHAGTLTPTYNSLIYPGLSSDSLGTISSHGSSVTITPTSIVAVDSAATSMSTGSITWTASSDMSVTLSFDYQITAPGGSWVLSGTGYGEPLMFYYTDGKVQSFSHTFDLAASETLFVQAYAQDGSVSISNIAVPEPSLILLLGLGLGAVGLVSARFKK